jgi:hypothetical protein
LVISVFRKAKATLIRRYRPRHVLTVDTPADLVECTFWTDRKPLRMMVSPGMLRMQGGFVYGPDHPFVAALDRGEPVLRAFYDRVRPAGLAAYCGLVTDGAGRDLPPWEIPWYGRLRRTPPPGELNLGPEHGLSFYGPVSDLKRALEMERLTGLDASIRRNGYDPDAYADIEGYVLRDGADAVFFVRGGKHRAAVLTHLKSPRIPVGFRARFPRLIDTAQAASWPLVRSGQIDEGLAIAMLRTYIRGQSAWSEP